MTSNHNTVACTLHDVGLEGQDLAL
jgi:hypothetical protein